MKIIATLCMVNEDGQAKAIAISPEGDKFFVNREDLKGEFETLADETEKSGTAAVLGILFGPEDAQ